MRLKFKMLKTSSSDVRLKAIFFWICVFPNIYPTVSVYRLYNIVIVSVNTKTTSKR